MINNLFYTRDQLNKITVAFDRSMFKAFREFDQYKYFLIVMFLRKRFDSLGQIYTNLLEIITECGYSSKTHNENMYNSFRKMLKQMEEEDYLHISNDIETIKPKNPFVISLNSDHSIFHTENPFVQCNMFEFDKIISNKTSTNKSTIIAIYLYIKQFISAKESDETQKVSYPSKQKISLVTGFSIYTIDNAISFLIQHGLLYESANYYVENIYHPGTYVPARKLYALDPKYLTDTLCRKSYYSIYNSEVFTIDEIDRAKVKYLSRK